MDEGGGDWAEAHSVGIGDGQAHVLDTISPHAPQHSMPSMPDGMNYTMTYLVLTACSLHVLRYPLYVQIEKDEDGEEVVLGHGQFGQVVKGRYRLAPVAVKRLTNQTASERAAFIKEMAILRACRGSRYIVPFVGASLRKVIPCPVKSLQLCLCASVGAPSKWRVVQDPRLRARRV